MKRKILFFINTLGGGGAEKVLVDLVNSLPSDIFDITVLTLQQGVHDKSILPHIHHRTIIQTNNKLVIWLLTRILCKLLPYRLFAKIFIGEEYETVISYLQGFNTRVVAASNAKKKITFVHSDLSKTQTIESLYKRKGDILKEYLTFCLRDCEKWI